MTSKFNNKDNKRKIYMILKRSVVTYTCETWTLSIQDTNNLLVVKTQILKMIFGPVKSKEGWRIRNNIEMQKMLKEKDTVKYITAQRIL
jgi:hypothetical protein